MTISLGCISVILAEVREGVAHHDPPSQSEEPIVPLRWFCDLPKCWQRSGLAGKEEEGVGGENSGDLKGSGSLR